MANLPRVALILTGGTIDSVGKDRLDLAWYIEAGKRLNDGELLQQLPELKEIAQVEETAVSPPAEPRAGRQRLARSRAHHPQDLRRRQSRRHRHHPRHQYHRRDRLFSESDAQDRQAGGRRRLHAAVVGDQRGRLFESGQRHQSRRRSELPRPRLLAGDERYDFQRPRRDQKRHLSRRSFSVARLGPARLRRRRRQDRLLPHAGAQAHDGDRVRRAQSANRCRASTWCFPTSAPTAR